MSLYPPTTQKRMAAQRVRLFGRYAGYIVVDDDDVAVPVVQYPDGSVLYWEPEDAPLLEYLSQPRLWEEAQTWMADHYTGTETLFSMRTNGWLVNCSTPPADPARAVVDCGSRPVATSAVAVPTRSARHITA